MNLSRFFSLIVFVLLTLGFAGGKPVTQEASSPAAAVVVSAAQLPVLGPAPAWSLKDLDGKAVSFAQFKGKTVVVDFWATWCGPCRMEIPGYIRLQKKYGKDGLVIVGISLDRAGTDRVRKFVQEQGINYTVVMGDEEILSNFGGVESIPTTFLIDRAGAIRDRKVGVQETTEYEKKILAVLR